jgi:hypothetical protein
MSDKPPYVADKSYVPRRTDAPGQSPAELRQGEMGTNEHDGTVHVMKSDGRVATLATAGGFSRIEAISQSEYDALVSATATISTVLYVVTPDPE